MKRLGYLLILILTCAACSPSQKKESGKPSITVTLEPLRYFAETLGADYFDFHSMVPKGSSPETYDPTPQQLVTLGKSQAYFKIGYIGFEQSWMQKLIDNTPNMKVFDTSTGVELIHEKAHVHGDHIHEGGVEPHIWNSTLNAKIISKNICEALSELDPAHKNIFEHRLDSLNGVISATDSLIRHYLIEADTHFLIYHPALSYFARDYHLNQISIEEGGKEPSPAQIQNLIKDCKKNNTRVIFVQQEFDVRNAKLIADEIGVRIVTINPLSYDWNKEMIQVAKALSHQSHD